MFKDKRGEDIFPNVIFIVVNILFFSMLMLFVFKASTGAMVYEQAYVKQIALLIDYSTPKTDVKIDFTDAVKVAKENKKTGDLVKIDDVNKEVIVSLSGQGGYAFKYFSDYDVSPKIVNNFLFISIKSKGAAPENLEDIWPDVKPGEIPVEKLDESKFKVRSLADMKKAIEYAKLNSVVNRNCLCGNNCEKYTQYLIDASTENGIPDPLLALSLMMQESSCEQEKVCPSTQYGGLMQVCCVISGCGKSKDTPYVENWNDEKTNIFAGTKELKSKYSNSCKQFSSACTEEYKTKTYCGWEYALRGYNGWGCNPSFPVQDKFVTQVIQRYEILKKVVEENKSE